MDVRHIEHNMWFTHHTGGSNRSKILAISRCNVPLADSRTLRIMNSASAPGLHRSDLPATCRAAADASAAGQARTKLLVRIELIALILAAVSGLTSLPIPPTALSG